MNNLNEKMINYIESTNKMKELQKEQKILRKSITEAEIFIKEYLENNNLTSVVVGDNSIILHEKKTNQNLNKENITTILREKISNEAVVNDVTNSLFNNAIFTKSCIKIKPIK